MAIDPIKPVTIQMAEEVSRRLNVIDTDPANGILKMPSQNPTFLVPSSPVPPLQIRLDQKFRAVPDMPHSALPKGLIDADPRMLSSAISGTSVNDIEFWKRATRLARSREELRRVVERQGWHAQEIAFLENHFAEALVLYALGLDRKRILRIKDDKSFNREAISQDLHQHTLSRDGLEAYTALVNKDRIWISHLMIGRAVDSATNTQNHSWSLKHLENEFFERDRIRSLEKSVESAASNLAGYQAATAYHIFKKIS